MLLLSSSFRQAVVRSRASPGAADAIHERFLSLPHYTMASGELKRLHHYVLLPSAAVLLPSADAPFPSSFPFRTQRRPMPASADLLCSALVKHEAPFQMMNSTMPEGDRAAEWWRNVDGSAFSTFRHGFDGRET